ncbi:MAG TPA: coenzyme F420-0:L-glutamate ligase [Dehalococcoidia bacterium]|nr:coenzyme F420-0:L-glutamate ligase [Dehalococcoidia bacterium]
MTVSIIPIAGLPEIRPGDDLGRLIHEAAETFEDGDIVVVTQRVVSKAEGRLVDLASVDPSPLALNFAARWEKDPRLVELVLRESRRIVRMERGIIIAETHHGLICANAGIDASNVVGESVVCLLPEDPDASAERLRERLLELGAANVAVIITDTFGRPWRVGQTNVAIGVAGMSPLVDYIGTPDTQGRELRVTLIASADEIAGAAELVMGKVENVPAAIVRGYRFEAREGRAAELIREADKDLFR